MNKLSKNVFFLCFSILSLSVLCFILVFNVQKYLDEKSKVQDNLKVALESEISKKSPNKNDLPIPDFDENNPEPIIKYMDKAMYTIILDEKNNIQDIINMSNENYDKESITSFAKKILQQSKTQMYQTKNLLTEKYSYAYNPGKCLILIDNSSIASGLLTYFGISLVLFVMVEIIIIIISLLLTKWITKPVKESFAKQKQFIANASHEIKTPLSIIMTSSDIIKCSKDDEKWLNNIKTETSRMSHLVNNLLELASSEKEEVYNIKKGNLSKEVELAVLTFEGKAYEKDLQIKYENSENIKTYFDENKIKELMDILLDNAIKHASLKSTIYVSLKLNQKHIELSVKNKGPAIPKGEEEKIFERFYRLDKSRNRNADDYGYGLGLSIAKNIVINHHGTIKAYSSKGYTTFQIILKK